MKKDEPVVLTKVGTMLYNMYNQAPDDYKVKEGDVFILLEDLKQPDQYVRILPVEVSKREDIDHRPFKQLMHGGHILQYDSGDPSSDKQLRELIAWGRKLNGSCQKALIEYCNQQLKLRIEGKRAESPNGQELELFVINWEG